MVYLAFLLLSSGMSCPEGGGHPLMLPYDLPGLGRSEAEHLGTRFSKSAGLLCWRKGPMQRLFALITIGKGGAG
jgi:hypothetical protein